MSPAVCLLLGKCHMGKVRKKEKASNLRLAEQRIRKKCPFYPKREKNKSFPFLGRRKYNQKNRLSQSLPLITGAKKPSCKCALLV